MGHKVHPMGFRIGVIRDWQAKWYAEKQFGEFVQEDLKLRQAIQSRYPEAGVSQVEISRQANEVFVTIYTSRPGVVIGRGGQRVDETRLHLEKLIDKRVRLNIMEIQQPELDATLVSRTVAEQLERRIAYRRAVKQAISRTIQAGAKGVRIRVAGRLGGAEIARSQTLHDGQVPLHTLRADIDYGFTEARTTFGRIGVKVWIYKGEILPEREEAPVEELAGVADEAEGAEAAAGAEPEEVPAAAEVETVEAAEPKEAPEVEAQAVEPTVEPVAEKKPAKPRARRAKAAPDAEAASGEAEVKEDTTEAAPSVTEEEAKDVTAEAGQAPQDT